MSKSSPPAEHDRFRLREKIILALSDRDLDSAKRFSDTFQDFQGESSGDLIVRLNRFWRHQLAALEQRENRSTYEERDHLVDQCSPSEWLRLFIGGVLPTVIIYRLPQQIV